MSGIDHEQNFIEFRDVSRVYKVGDVEIPALSGATFSIARGELCVIVGASGAGKTTLLNILGGMDTLTGGSACVDGEDLAKLNKRRRTKYRRRDIGFVFQFYNLIPNLTARENVQLASQICREHIPPEEALSAVGLADRMDNFPAQLSGGEQQRVAIARAIAKKPKLLLCDEPTGALDYKTGKQVLKLLQDSCRRSDVTVVIVTHNSALCEMADRVIRVKSGGIESVSINPAPLPIDQIEW